MYITSTLSFPTHLWASSDVNQKRTTNGCESFHKHLNSLFYTAHPSVFELTDRLQEIMSESKFKLQSTANLRTSKAKDFKKRERLLSIQGSFYCWNHDKTSVHSVNMPHFTAVKNFVNIKPEDFSFMPFVF